MLYSMRTIIVLVVLLLISLLPTPLFAANYTVQTGILYRSYSFERQVSSLSLNGFNKTHGFSQAIPVTNLSAYGGNPDFYSVSFTLPDDGSNWTVVGVFSMLEMHSGDFDGSDVDSFVFNCTTPGTYTGPSLANILSAANNASTQATSAAAAATNASTNATNTLSAVSNANGNTITAVRDAGGTVLTEARQAKTNSQNAYNIAQAINTKVVNLENSITNLNTSINGVDSDNSEIAAAVKAPSGNTITAVRDASGTVLEASRSAYNEINTANTKIDNLQTTVNNIENVLGQDSTAPVVKLRTVSGAMATSGNSIQAVISASDNVSTVFDYSLDGNGFQPLPPDGVVDLPINNSGKNLITVWVRDAAGNTGRESITIRKL